MTLKVYELEGQWIVRLTDIGSYMNRKHRVNRYGKILDVFPTKQKANQFVNKINNAVSQYIDSQSEQKVD